MRILPLVLILSAAAAPALAQQAPASSNQLRLRMLTWPGKVVAPAPRPAQAAQPFQDPGPAPVAAPTRTDLAWSPAYRPVQHGRTHMLGEVTPAQQAAIDAQRAADRAAAEQARAEADAEKRKQAQAAPPPPPARAPNLPTSIYAAPAAAAQTPPDGSRMAMAAPYDQKARFYSLHRSFGERPDPIVLSPQFLSTPSADLADPPPPPAPRLLPGQTATPAQQTAARVQARDSGSSD